MYMYRWMENLMWTLTCRSLLLAEPKSTSLEYIALTFRVDRRNMKIFAIR